MEIPLAKEVFEILPKIGIKVINGDHPLLGELLGHCSGLRSYLLKTEGAQTRRPLLANTFWDIIAKYRLDVLTQDIPKVANQLAYAIAFATLYLDYIAEAGKAYFPNAGNHFFWYHIDFGLRLASSGWDRIALLLDLAYELNTGTKCGLATVLKEIPKKDANIVKQNDFKELKKFRDNWFLDLEANAGEGARHEATHLLSPSSRFLFEFLDGYGKTLDEVPLKLSPKTQRDLLIEHHGFYVSGIGNAIRLVLLRWP